MKNIRDFLLVFEPMSKEHPGSFVLLKANCRGPDSTQHQIGVLTGDRWTRPLNVAPQRFPMLRSNDNCAHHEVGMSVPEFCKRQYGNVDAPRADERREGKEGVSSCRARWSPYH